MQDTAHADLATTRFVAANHRRIQGLGGAALGAGYLVMAAGMLFMDASGPRDPMGDVALGIFVAGCLGGNALSLWLHRRDRLRYGQAYSPLSRWEFVLPGLAAVLYLVLVFTTDLARVPISLVGLLYAGLAVWPWWRWRRQAPHYLVVGGVLALISAAPLGVLLGTHPLNTGPGMFAAVGTTLVVNGICEHRIIVSVLGRRAPDDE